MSKVYISGPITGTEGYEQKFAAVENELKKRGAVPINPVRVNSVLPEDSSHEDYMKLSIAVLSVCDCICMLNGWEQSKGAREELCYALDHKIPIVFEV